MFSRTRLRRRVGRIRAVTRVPSLIGAEPGPQRPGGLRAGRLGVRGAQQVTPPDQNVKFIFLDEFKNLRILQNFLRVVNVYAASYFLMAPGPMSSIATMRPELMYSTSVGKKGLPAHNDNDEKHYYRQEKS